MHDIAAFSIRQPFAQFLVAGIKKDEARSWSPTELGWYLVHASTGRSPSHAEYSTQVWYRRALKRAGLSDDPSQWTYGAIIGAVEIVRVLPASTALSTSRRNMTGTPAANHVLWRIGGAIVLDEPITCPGKLMLWQPPATAIAKVLRQLR